jgi:hypothetical protein
MELHAVTVVVKQLHSRQAVGLTTMTVLSCFRRLLSQEVAPQVLHIFSPAREAVVSSSTVIIAQSLCSTEHARFSRWSARIRSSFWFKTMHRRLSSDAAACAALRTNGLHSCRTHVSKGVLSARSLNKDALMSGSVMTMPPCVL